MRSRQILIPENSFCDWSQLLFPESWSSCSPCISRGVHCVVCPLKSLVNFARGRLCLPDDKLTSASVTRMHARARWSFLRTGLQDNWCYIPSPFHTTPLQLVESRAVLRGCDLLLLRDRSPLEWLWLGRRAKSTGSVDGGGSGKGERLSHLVFEECTLPFLIVAAVEHLVPIDGRWRTVKRMRGQYGVGSNHILLFLFPLK